MIFVEAGFVRDVRGHFFAVAREHDRMGNTQFFDALNGFDGVFLDGVFDFDRAAIFAIDRKCKTVVFVSFMAAAIPFASIRRALPASTTCPSITQRTP